jgi:deoxyribodipyrimidine photo-lyase
MIQESRVQQLARGKSREGDYVLYWMQQSQRVTCNHALEFAIRKANELSLPLVVLFVLTDNYPEANLRHYAFMLQGLAETAEKVRERGAFFTLRRGHPPDEVPGLAGRSKMTVVDRGYLRHQVEWRQKVAGTIPVPFFQVEADALIPVNLVMEKEAYSAAVLRRRIKPLFNAYLAPLEEERVKNRDLPPDVEPWDRKMVRSLEEKLECDRSLSVSPAFRGGENEALRLLELFIETRLARYHELRNHPDLDYQSHLGPYLHFGQVSPLMVARRVLEHPSEGADAFIEELVVRRELSLNYVTFNGQYDSFKGLPEWARRTLQVHVRDRREYIYERDRLLEGKTHDPYWNAAQRQLEVTGSMHNYMRMYWGKKILEWSRTPEEAFSTALYLNNRFSLDGRDANSFAGVAWCFGKHDRPWKERPVFGKVRYMNDRGLERKFNMKGYLEKVESLV